MAAVLLDEDVPVKLRDHFRDDWDVQTVAFRGWKGTRNSELLAAAADEFDVLVTLDTSIRHQQNLGRYGLALLVLRGRTDRLEDLVPLMQQVNQFLPDEQVLPPEPKRSSSSPTRHSRPRACWASGLRRQSHARRRLPPLCPFLIPR